MAFLQEPERQPFLRIPAATVSLVAVLVIAHIARIMAPALLQQNIVWNYGFVSARYSHAFLVAHHVGQQSIWDLAVPFVSYIFLHGSFAHLAVNCAFLLPFGAIVARRFGTLTFFAFFLVCGIAGACAHLVTHWGSTEPAIGASAAVSGLMAAGFRMIAFDEAPDAFAFADGATERRRPLSPILGTRLLVWSALFIVVNVVAGLLGIGAGTGPVVVAWEAHIGGYFAGLFLAGPFDALGQLLQPKLRGQRAPSA